MTKLLTILIPFLLTIQVFGQDSSGQKFISISHSSDRTIAKDSVGDTYYYNNESGEFESSESYRSSTSSSEDTDFGDSDVILPPEKRCTDVHYGDISEFFNEVEIGLDERIEGTVFCFNDIVINGLVTRDVVSLQTVTVTGTGEVRGDVIGKDIRRERGGKILGQRQEVPFPDVFSLGVPRVGSVTTGVYHFLLIFVLLFIAIIIAALAPKPLGRVVNRLSLNFVASFFWGLLFWLALVPVLVLLVITIVGIPLIIIYPFVILFAILLGYAAIAQTIGERVCGKFNWHQKSLYARIACGVLALELPHLLYVLLESIGLDALGTFFLVMYYIIGFFALSIGVGAALSSKFGMKPKAKIQATVHYQASPPPPRAPGVVPPPISPAPNMPPPPSPPPRPEIDENDSKDSATQ